MFIHDNADGTKTLILDAGESITVELPGGNGGFFIVSADGTVKDEDGFNVTAAAYQNPYAR